MHAKHSSTPVSACCTSFQVKTSSTSRAISDTSCTRIINYSRTTIKCRRQFATWINDRDRRVYRGSFAVEIAARLFENPDHSSDPDRLTIEIVSMASDANYSHVPICGILGQIIDVPWVTENVTSGKTIFKYFSIV